MAEKSNAPKGVSPAILGIVVTLLVLFVGWLAYANLFAPPKPPPLSPEAEQRTAEYDALAKKTHGDFSKLSPDEQTKMNEQTGGRGPMILQGIAKSKGY